MPTISKALTYGDIRQTGKRLVCDVGLYTGDDTAYYLSCGFSVVAIDANPLLIEQNRTRFADELAQGRLLLLNVGIGSTEGTATFWISECPTWSSFGKSYASRNGVRCDPVSVPVMPLRSVLAGLDPYYIKIDIEGNDKICLDSLQGGALPEYISVESECTDEKVALSDEEALSILRTLQGLGYRRFKLVNQDHRYTARQNRIANLYQQVGTRAAEVAPWQPMKRAINAFTDIGKINKLGYPFPGGSTGPFGENVPGKWMDYTVAEEVYLRERHRHFRASRHAAFSFWNDWHATR